MKKYLILSAIMLAIVSAFGIQQRRIESLKTERDKYRANSEVLLQSMTTYRTSDSLNAAKVGELELTVKEYKQYFADDFKKIQTLQLQKRDLERITATQLQTINELKGSFRDTIIYLSGDTVVNVMRCLDIVDNWYELHGCADETGQFTGKYESRDSLLMVESVQYRRFCGFLWKTKKIKSREVDIVSKNPYTTIAGIEFVRIDKG